MRGWLGRGLRIAAIIGGGLCALVLLAVLALPYIDVAGLVAGRASAALGRPVRVAGLRVSPGRWITVRLRDAAIGNLPGGTRAEMVTLGAVEAEIDATSLLSGPIVVRRLVIDGLDVLLEKAGEEGVPNWRFGPARPAKGPDYAGLPTMLDATLSGRVTFRTSSGKALVSTFDGVRVVTPDRAQPVRLSGPGSYQGVPVALDVTLASFDAVRAAPKPVPAEIRLSSGDTALMFKGTLRAPLDVDGAQGELTIDAPTPGVIERVAGIDPTPAPALHLLGTLDRDGSKWNLANTTGAVGASRIVSGDLTLEEGKPDRIAVVLDFEKLDLDTLLGGAKGSSGSDLPILVGRNPATLLDVKLSAAVLAYAGLDLRDPRIEASLQPGVVAVEALGFGYLGGQFSMSGRLETQSDGASAHVGGEISATALDVQALRRVLGAGSLPLSGRATGHVHIEADGATLNRAAKSARLSAVVTLQGGSIARELIELASTDARALFRSAKGNVAVTCLLGIVDVRAGVGTVSPLRIRTAEGTIAGRGRFDLIRRSLDITVASESRTTGFFALDVPVRISGSFDDPAVAPATLSGAGRAQLSAGDNVGRLLPALRTYARASPCLERMP